MIYNPIFEEEKEKKLQFKQLKKEIKHRAHKEGIKNTIDRLYNLMQKKLLQIQMACRDYLEMLEEKIPLIILNRQAILKYFLH